MPADVPRTVEQRILEEWWRVPGSVVSGWASCRLYGAGYLDGTDERGAELPVPLVVAPEQSPRAGSGARIVRQPLVQDHRTRVHGIAVPIPGRAMVEAARLADDREAAVLALEMAYAAGVALPEWVRAALDVAPPRGLRQVRDAVAVAGVRSCSPPETRLRLVCLALGWDPQANIEVFDHDGRFLARPDLLDVERGLAIEYDGAMHRSRERHRRDNERLHLMRGAGLEVVTIVGGGVVGPRARREAAALLREGARLAAHVRERRWTLEGPPHAVRWIPLVDQLREAVARGEVS